MNTRAFVNRFPEIASKSKAEQIALLEQARYIAFTKFNLACKSALFFVLSLVIGLLFPISTYFALSPSVVSCTLAIGTGCFVTLFLYQKLYASLLKQGLNVVLNNNST